MKHSRESMKLLAEKYGGACLSNEYINSKTKMLWRCAKGHTFVKKPNAIISGGQWCPECKFDNAEEKCRYIFEKLTNNKFPRTRKVVEGFELDGYCEQLKLAFEHNGRFHYEHIEYFDKTIDEFERRVRSDILKKKRCYELGIKLIIIPQDVVKSDEDLLHFISTNLVNSGIKVSSINEFTFKEFYIKSPIMEELQALAIAKGGKCLSKDYEGAHKLMLWECSCGNKWFAKPNTIKNGHWCFECNGNQKKTIEEMRTIAHSKGGKCLSNEYLGAHVHLEWECSKGHRWKSKPMTVINQGTWCRKCSGKEKGTIEQMRQLAGRYGGECLSLEYVNRRTKLQWRCNEGHIWERDPASIAKGQWCSICRGTRKSK
ncbi:hypothetical protein [Paenibacillus sp. HJGM_3]|uniref:hypothetical protein n=1 Tax=Paenibacillus sp. HJGM_3 TaxID=3379816 RepID=UPI003858F0DE